MDSETVAKKAFDFINVSIAKGGNASEHGIVLQIFEEFYANNFPQSQNKIFIATISATPPATVAGKIASVLIGIVGIVLFGIIIGISTRAIILTMYPNKFKDSEK